MTSPSIPDEPGFWLKMIFDELKSINGKLDGHSERLTALEARQEAQTRDIQEHKAAVAEKTKSLSASRLAVWIAIGSVLSGGLFTIVPLLIH
jgi:uncharacterized coiled-coil protein SlyX